MRSCCAVIFCGGRATRLHSVLDGLPKALIPLDKTPYIEGLLTSLRVAGVSKMVLCVSPFVSSIKKYVRDGSKFGVSVRYSIDDGTIENAGALWTAFRFIDTPNIICMNGDTLVDVNLQDLVKNHLCYGGVSTLVGSSRKDQPHTGAIVVDVNGVVRGIYEYEQDMGSTVEVSDNFIRMSNSGFYVFNKLLLRRNWPLRYRVGKLEQGLLRFLARKRLLWAYYNGSRYLLDIGTEDRLNKAEDDIDQIGNFFPL